MTQQPTKKRLGERLIEAGMIDEIQLTVALGMQKETGLKIGKQLMKLGFIGEAELSEFLRDETDFTTPLTKRNITDKAVKSVPQDLAFKHKIMPIAFAGDTIVIAMNNPNDMELIDMLTFQLGKKIHAVRALEWDIESALLKYYKFFSDEELEMLTSVSNVAEQYNAAQWSVAGDTVSFSDEGMRIDEAASGRHADEFDFSMDATSFADQMEPISAAPARQYKNEPTILPSAPKPPAAKPPARPAPAAPTRPAAAPPVRPAPAARPAASPPGTARPAPPAAPTRPTAPPAARPAPARPAAAPPPTAPPARPAAPQPARAAAPPPAPRPAPPAAARPPMASLSELAAFNTPSIQKALIELLIEKNLIDTNELVARLKKK